MNRISIAILVVLAFFATSLSAQSTFVMSYGTNDVEGGKCLVKDQKGNFIIGGYKGDSSLILRVTPEGAVVSRFTFRGLPGGPVENVVHMFVDRDFNLVGVGQARANFATYLFKFDINANSMIWLRESPMVADLGYITEFPGKDDYFVCGDNKNNTSPGLAIDGHLFRINRNTGALSTLNRNYNLGATETFSYMALINDTLYISGRYNKDGGGSAGMRHALTAMDTLGNIYYTRMYFVPTGTSARMYHAAVAVDGDSLLLGCSGNASGTSFSSNFNMHVTKVSHSGLNSWAKEYFFQGYDAVTLRHLETIPTGYIGAGYSSDSNKDLLLFELDKLGRVVWAKRFGGTGDEVMGPVAPLMIDNGSIYFTGMSTFPGTGEDVVLIKVNMNGELEDPCSFSSDQVVTTSDYGSLYNGLETLNDYVRNHTLNPPSTLSSPTFLDKDTVCWSISLAVEPSIDDAFSLRVTSGMSSGRLTGFYTSATGGLAKVQVISSLGVNVLEQELRLSSGSGRFELDFPHAAGVYFLRLTDQGSQKSKVVRFLVM